MGSSKGQKWPSWWPWKVIYTGKMRCELEKKHTDKTLEPTNSFSPAWKSYDCVIRSGETCELQVKVKQKFREWRNYLKIEPASHLGLFWKRKKDMWREKCSRTIRRKTDTTVAFYDQLVEQWICKWLNEIWKSHEKSLKIKINCGHYQRVRLFFQPLIKHKFDDSLGMKGKTLRQFILVTTWAKLRRQVEFIMQEEKWTN